MRLFSESTKALNAIQKAASLVGDFPDSVDRTSALSALADAGAHTLRASAGCVLTGRPPAVEYCECPQNDASEAD